MGRQPCCEKIGLNRGPWTMEEDQKLINFILNNGIQCWRLVPKLSGLMRCGKSCRLRWTNYLRPDLKRGALSEAEEEQIIQLHSRLGNRWSKIASHFPGRTDNEIKNHWNTRIKKRLKLLGLDPVTHKSMELSDKCDAKGDHSSHSDTSQAEEKSVEIMSMVDGKQGDIQVLEETQNGVIEMGSDASNLLLQSNGTSWESLDILEEMKAEAKPSSSCSTSFSLDDILYPSVGGKASLEGSNLGWSDDIDSFTSWDALYHLEDIFPLGDYP